MFCAATPIEQAMAPGLFFTNHMQVLALVAEQPDLRLREIADRVGITERGTHRIISELVEAGYLARTRVGSRNQYSIVRLPSADSQTAEVMRAITEQPSANGLRLIAADAQRFKAVFDAAPAAVAVADTSGKILSTNREFCAVLGRTEQELLGRPLHAYAHPDDAAAEQQRLARLTDGHRSEDKHETRYVRADGTISWVRVRVAPTVDPQSGARLHVAHVVEIGEPRRQQQELAEAEERFRSAFDNAPIGMALVALDGRWLKVNKAICEITGYSETALLTRTFQSITHPDDLDADLEFVRQMLAGEIRSYQMDKRYYHANGHLIWVSLSVSLVRDPSGKPLYFISQVKDITHRRAAEESLHRVVDRIAEAVSIIDSDGTRLHANKASQMILDDLRTRFEQGPIADLDWGAIAEDRTPVPADQLPAEITRVTGEEINDAVFGFPSATEEIRWLRISTRRLSDGSPPYQVIVSYTDITWRKQAERALALSQARLQALFRYIPAALSLRDLDGRYLQVTDSVARALGCTAEDAVGRHPSEHLSGELLSQMLADDEALRAGRGPISQELTVKHADGSDRDYYVVKWPVHDENGAVAALGAFSLDVTERKQAERRIRELLESAS
jgi:PAS domain S-box-containing protein